MFHLGWVSCWILLILCTSACGLEVYRDGSHEVTCSQGLSNCTMKYVLPPRLASNDVFDIVNLTPDFKLCCKDRALCRLCMAVDIEMKLSRHHENSKERSKGSEDTSDTKAAASVTVCYMSASAMPACKQVEFTVNRTQREAKISIVVPQPAGVTFSSQVKVYSPQSPSVYRKVVVPSISEACSREMSGRLEECDVPKVSAVINIETNQVELQPADGANGLPAVCVQHESDGRCQEWDRMNISLHSVTPCTCFQVWNDNDMGQRRSQICPFNSTDFLMRNVWENASLSLARVQKYGRPLLSWNLSAPCRLDGEVWPCCPLGGCGEPQDPRQHLSSGTWRQNGWGGWEQKGVFEDFSCPLPPCLMVKVRGVDVTLGPYCISAARRWRWSLLVLGATLLLCLTVLTACLTGNFVKKWVWKWHHGRFVKIGWQGPVLLLSPPDVDDGLSKSVCDLSTLLRHQGFSVTLDSCCRREQCHLGPIPWLYSQMMKLNAQDGRAVLVLTPAAVERALEWELRDKMKEEEGDHPHSAIFKSSLVLINSDRQKKAGGRFVLVTFDADLRRTSRLPELLSGLRLFQLPSQTKALLTELAVRGGHLGTRPRALRSRDTPPLSPSEMKPFICVMPQ